MFQLAGPITASRGDRILITVMFENEKVDIGRKQVPVSFCLNGRKMITKEGKDRFFVNSKRSLHPYIGMTDGYSALAKVRSKNGP